MNRGEIYWVAIPARDPQGTEITKTRPCIVVGAPALNRIRSTILMVPLTSNNKPYPPISIAMSSIGQGSVAVCDQLLAVDKSRIKNLAGALTAQELDSLDESLKQVLAL
jgi:mRNA interferase MazF